MGLDVDSDYLLLNCWCNLVIVWITCPVQWPTFFWWVSCTVYGTCKYFFSFTKITLKLGPMILFTHLKIILLQYFQFWAISGIQTNPYTRDLINFNINYLAKFGILTSLKKKKKLSLIRYVKSTNKNDFCLNATFIFQKVFFKGIYFLFLKNTNKQS